DGGGVDRVERGVGGVARVHARRGAQAVLEEAVEGAEEEVAAAAGRVDQIRVVEAELRDGGLEGAVEDEALDEVRGLQQREALADALVQVLVEVAEEAGVRLAEAQGTARRRGRSRPGRICSGRCAPAV